MKKSILCASLAGLAMASVTANAQNLVTNGSFEESGYNSPQQFQSGNPFAITGWTNVSTTKQWNGFWFDSATAVTAGATAYANSGPTYYLPSSFNNVHSVAGDTLAPGASQIDPDGGHFLALDGSRGMTIAQTITGLTVGEAATLSFYWGATQLQNESGPITEQLNVSLGGQTQTTATLSEGTHYFSGWIKQTFTFIPTSTTEVLQFASIGTPLGLPPMAVLDGVSLTQVKQTTPPPVVTPVPEPSVYALMLGGLGVLAYLHKRRRNNRA